MTQTRAMFSDAGIPTFDTPEDAVHASLQIVHYRRAQDVLMQVPPAAPGDLAVEAMRQRLSRLQPEARLQGFSVQPMVRRAQAHELIVGVTTDPVFGPVILFGQEGVAVEVSADHAVLPPLNMVLARDMVSRTRISKLPSGYRNRPKADSDAICRTLIQVAQLVIDAPEIAELNINPLLANAQRVIALDARMRVTVSPISRRPCSCRPASRTMSRRRNSYFARRRWLVRRPRRSSRSLCRAGISACSWGPRPCASYGLA